jgi:uncharacterized protein YwbE
MALDPVVNFFRSSIATLPLYSGDTTLVLLAGDGAKLPDPAVSGAFNLVVYDAEDPFVGAEIVRVTARSNDTLTILRGQEGTDDTTKDAGILWAVDLSPTAKMIQDIDTGKINVGDVVDNLLSTSATAPLSAGQGKVLEDGKVDKNADITGATNTKITFDAKGLVTAGTDADIADITGLQTALDAKDNSSIGATGVVIDFTTSKVFNSPSSPETGNITENLTGAKIGIVQKIYHNHSVAPSVPAGWVRVGTGDYELSVLNLIFAEWVGSSRVEYWIIQEA